jgi:hypothetical protein
VIQRENVTFYFPLVTCLLLSVPVQPGVLGREPLKRRSCHRAECRAPRAVFPGETPRVRFDAGAPFRASFPDGFLSTTAFDNDNPIVSIVDERQCRLRVGLLHS